MPPGGDAPRRARRGDRPRRGGGALHAGADALRGVALALLGLVLAFALAAPARAEDEAPPSAPPPHELGRLWYSTSNGGAAAGTLPDFLDLFDPRTEHLWAAARSRLGVFTLHESDLNRLDGAVVAGTIVPALVRWKVDVNVDWGAATWAGCRTEAARWRSRERLLEILDALRDSGVRVRAVSLQSVLSKAVPGDRKTFPNCPSGEYPMELRIADTVELAAVLKQNGYGDLRLGVVDALVAHGRPMPEVRAAYRDLRDAMSRASVRLDFVHLDHPFDQAQAGPSNWRRVAEAVDYLQGTLGVAAGVVLVGSETDDEVAFRGKVVGALEQLHAAGARPRHLHVWSWLRNPATGRPVPARELPEDATDPDSPMTKNLLAVAEAAARLDAAPPGLPAGP